jgi:hypothetical protein
MPIIGAICPILSIFGDNCPRFLKNLPKIDFWLGFECPAWSTGINHSPQNKPEM